MNTLLHLPFSPWSERALWALDARQVPYRRRVYQPLFGEPELRLRLKRWRGNVSVPVLLTDGGAIGDSFDIARFADAHGSGPALFPAGQEERVRRYNEASERALAAGRSLALTRMRTDRDALLEMVPRQLRGLGGAAAALARMGTDRTLRKYGSAGWGEQESRATVRAVLEELRRDLGAAPAARDGGPKTLLGSFSYADVTMAQALVFIAPPAREHVRIGRASRRVFADAALASEFADLVAWRDALYERWRGTPRRN